MYVGGDGICRTQIAGPHLAAHGERLALKERPRRSRSHDFLADSSAWNRTLISLTRIKKFATFY
jgi:hypothetical protein